MTRTRRGISDDHMGNRMADRQQGGRDVRYFPACRDGMRRSNQSQEQCTDDHPRTPLPDRVNHHGGPAPLLDRPRAREAGVSKPSAALLAFHARSLACAWPLISSSMWVWRNKDIVWC